MKTLVQKTLWNGSILIDIRKHFLKDGELLPSRKGISLTPRQFEQLLKDFSESYEWSTEEFMNSLPINLVAFSQTISIDFKRYSKLFLSD